jgi:hypothetical protein
MQPQTVWRLTPSPFSDLRLGRGPLHAIPKIGEDEAKEKRERKDGKQFKRKLPAPKDGWLDKKRYCLAVVLR